MLYIVALAASVLQPTATLPAGYYTLREASAKLTACGIAAKAASDCENDVYGLRLTNRTADSVKAALEADGRLVVTDSSGTWLIQRSSEGQAEDAQLERYLSKIRQSIHATYSIVADSYRRASTLPSHEADALRDRLVKEARQAGNDSLAELIYLSAYELPFATFGFVELLTAPTPPRAFCTTLLTNSWEARELLSPKEAERFGRTFSVGAKLTLDPLTLATAERNCIYRSTDRFWIVQGGAPHPISPENVSIQMNPSDVWTPEELSSQRRRAAANPAPKGAEAGRPKVAGSRRVSRALLKAADASKTDLVAYVSPLADYVLRSGGREDIAATLVEANGSGIDPSWLKLSARERVMRDTEGGKAIAVEPVRRFTVSNVDGIAVVRNEMRFLDGLVTGPPGMPTSIENDVLGGKPAPGAAVVGHLAGLDIKTWQTSVFASTYLSYCNPTAFHPFARVLAKSPKLRVLIGSVAPGKPVTKTFGELEPTARKALVDGMIDASLICDTSSMEGPDPMVAGAQVRDAKVGECVLQISNESGSAVVFSVLIGEKRVWSAWIKNVDWKR